MEKFRTYRENMDSPENRRRELAMIHIAKKQLGLDEDGYREIIFNVTGCKSAALLDLKGRADLVDYFKGMGFKPVHKSARKSGLDVKPASDKEGIFSKISAILTDLKLPWTYADGMAKKMFRVDRVKWLSPDQLHKLMVALIYHQKRRRAA
jgi:phage gp16-like protein